MISTKGHIYESYADDVDFQQKGHDLELKHRPFASRLVQQVPELLCGGGPWAVQGSSGSAQQLPGIVFETWEPLVKENNTSQNIMVILDTCISRFYMILLCIITQYKNNIMSSQD